MSTQPRLDALLARLSERTTLTEGEWWAIEDKPLPGHDFNREIIKPGTQDEFPHGCLGIRVDDDLWAVAALPPEFEKVPLAIIVKELWPHITDAKFCPDHGTPLQELYFERREVAIRAHADDAEIDFAAVHEQVLKDIESND